MDKKELLKKIDDRINYLKENNIQPSELDKYINDLCNTKNFDDCLLLSLRMKNYIEKLPDQESAKIDILKTLSKYDDIFREFCDFLSTGKVLKKRRFSM